MAKEINADFERRLEAARINEADRQRAESSRRHTRQFASEPDFGDGLAYDPTAKPPPINANQPALRVAEEPGLNVPPRGLLSACSMGPKRTTAHKPPWRPYRRMKHRRRSAPGQAATTVSEAQRPPER